MILQMILIGINFSFCRDEKSKAKFRHSQFFGAAGQAKTGAGRNEIPPLTQVELNFAVNVSTVFIAMHIKIQQAALPL